MSRMTLIAVGVAVLATTACKKKEEAKPSAAEPAPAPPAEPPAAAPAPAEPAAKPTEAEGSKVFEYATPQALNDDWRSVKGAAFMDKFGLDGRFRVTGPIEQTTTAAQGGATGVVFKVGDKDRLTLKFADGGKAVAAKGVKKGDTIKALCKGGGSDDHEILLTDCTLE